MGICDIIPGISGGTIAFITGIYYRLIEAVKNFSPKLLIELFRNFNNKKELKNIIKKLDLAFLISLVLGIGTSVLIGSWIISYLLDNYFVYTISFFIGLILASAKVIFNRIDNHKSLDVLFGVVGLGIGIILSIIVPMKVVPSLGYVFLGGFLAISAMFLPGISGAFILLILGIYEFMLGVLHDMIGSWHYLLTFFIGAGLGVVVISRVISYLFEKDKARTLYVLLGLVIGTLSIPVKRAYNLLTADINILLVVVFIVVGIVIVRFVTARGSK